MEKNLHDEDAFGLASRGVAEVFVRDSDIV